MIGPWFEVMSSCFDELFLFKVLALFFYSAVDAVYVLFYPSGDKGSSISSPFVVFPEFKSGV